MPVQKEVKVADLRISNTRPFTLFAGPCVIESRDHVFKMAESLCELTAKLDIPFIFKASFDKANRTSLKGKRGVGMDEGLAIFSDIKAQFGCPVITDIHAPDQCSVVAEVADVLQIPAFLCRQTDLLVAAAKTGRAINVKKGQFLAPWDMKNVAEKLTESGNENIMLCERGASFGYNTLVSDMRSLPIMAQTGHPVVFDATHSVQQPGGQGSSSGGQREFVPVLARAALAVGVAAVFMETHDNPDEAFSDGPNMVPLDALQDILKVMKKFDQIAKENPVSI